MRRINQVLRRLEGTLPVPCVHLRWELEHSLYPIPRCLPISKIHGVVGDGPDVGHIPSDKERRLGEGVSPSRDSGQNTFLVLPLLPKECSFNR